MRLIGVTGGIASGKSHAVRTFARLGAVTFSADEAARAILIPHGRVMKALVETFGGEILLPTGCLNRALLGQRVFQNPHLRHQLEAITHPSLLHLLATQIESAHYELSPQTTVVVEMPLLYEVGLEHWFDTVLVVSSTTEEQVARLLQRSQMSEVEAKRRLQAQMPLEEKCQRADIVIENHDSLDALERQLLQVWRELQTEKGRHWEQK